MRERDNELFLLQNLLRSPTEELEFSFFPLSTTSFQEACNDLKAARLELINLTYFLLQEKKQNQNQTVKAHRINIASLLLGYDSLSDFSRILKKFLSSRKAAIEVKN